MESTIPNLLIFGIELKLARVGVRITVSSFCRSWSLVHKLRAKISACFDWSARYS